MIKKNKKNSKIFQINNQTNGGKRELLCHSFVCFEKIGFLSLVQITFSFLGNEQRPCVYLPGVPQISTLNVRSMVLFSNGDPLWSLQHKGEKKNI